MLKSWISLLLVTTLSLSRSLHNSAAGGIFCGLSETAPGCFFVDSQRPNNCSFCGLSETAEVVFCILTAITRRTSWRQEIKVPGIGSNISVKSNDSTAGSLSSCTIQSPLQSRKSPRVSEWALRAGSELEGGAKAMLGSSHQRPD